MRLSFLRGNSKTLWQNNKAFIIFLLRFITILTFVKIIFYYFNYSILFPNENSSVGVYAELKMLKWSILYDFLICFSINIPLLLILQILHFFKVNIKSVFILPFFILVNSIVLVLNIIDIFYYRFHLQRANADLLYVIDHPFQEFFHQGIITIMVIITVLAFLLFIVSKLHFKFYKSFIQGSTSMLTSLVFLCIVPVLVLNRISVSKKMLPSYPLIDLSSKQLPVVQNSAHTFVYSLFRSGQTVFVKKYLTNAVCDSILPIYQKMNNQQDTLHKNVVLFIMESCSYDYFDATSKYKVSMPFFDSIQQISTMYSNAFCYALESNKGISAILGSVPTLTDIPIYHSEYVNLPITTIGTALKQNHYSSFFCIGDDYDNFGFAKCANWLGIDKYYSKEDMGKLNNNPMHTMGMQDEFVLNFFEEKIKEEAEPFFAVNFNISTHYPYDLPASFHQSFSSNYTNPMKAVRYYDNCLHTFFDKAKSQPWYKNTIFIFCADHWMYPDLRNAKINYVNSYRIPIVIFDPSKTEKIIDNSMVSQFDILGTILSVSGYKQPYISYGGNLLDGTSKHQVVFTKRNGSIFQAIDSSYILGYNSTSNTAEYLYNYKTDETLKLNLVDDKSNLKIKEELSLQIRAFLQKASMQYNSIRFK